MQEWWRVIRRRITDLMRHASKNLQGFHFPSIPSSSYGHSLLTHIDPSIHPSSSSFFPNIISQCLLLALPPSRGAYRSHNAAHTLIPPTTTKSTPLPTLRAQSYYYFCYIQLPFVFVSKILSIFNTIRRRRRRHPLFIYNSYSWRSCHIP